ncbi:hypothetical protein DL96DRAFT_1250891 [Flagelloscypha sp. PMI_526]|nr:hypothetical protein DL96DRAFT_1250891 [Flagelloscypha sp. PMI_526]
MGAFDLTLGALLLGCSFNVYLYGLASFQYVSYATLGFDDPIWLRALVAILFAIDTSQTIIELYGLWHLGVENYANPSVLTNVFWFWPFCGMSLTFSAVIVQGFFIHRLRGLTKQVWLCGFLMVLVAGAWLTGVITSTKSALLVDVTEFGPLIPLVTAWLAIDAGADIIITVTLSRALWRSKTGMAETNTIIHRCIRAAVQSGLFPSVFAFASLLSFILWTDTYLYMIFGLPLGRIYSNSFLYTLIIRKELSRMIYGTSAAGQAGTNSFPTPHQISSVHFHRDTATDTTVDGDNIKTSLDRSVVLLPPKGSD